MKQPSGRFVIDNRDGRNVQCARLSLKQTLVNYLESSIASENRPTPPEFTFFSGTSVNAAVVVELLIDSGLIPLNSWQNS